MKKILATDGALKLMSVIIAIGIWIYIALVVDPTIEITVRDLPIQFIGAEALDAKNLSVISESSTTVSVNIKGSRKKMGQNDMKTIIARADISGITDTGENTVPIDIVIPFENQGISSQSDYTVTVKVESRVTKEFDIRINTYGSLAPDYMPGDISTEPAVISLVGPKSAVEKISEAAVRLDYANEDVDIDKELPVTFYGSDGKEISMLDALMKRISVSAESVKVHCPVMKMHRVPIKARFDTAALPEGFSYKTEPSEVYIFGSDKAMAENTEILTDIISVDKLYGSGKVKVKINIPEGVKIFDDISEVEITLENN